MKDYSEINSILEELSQYTTESENFSLLKEKFFKLFNSYEEVYQLTILMRETEKYEKVKKMPFYLQSLYSSEPIKKLLL